MWNQLTPQQQQFLMAMLMGQQGQGSANSLLANGYQGAPPAWSQMPSWMQQGQQPPWLQGFLNQPASGAPPQPPTGYGFDGSAQPAMGAVGAAPGGLQIPQGTPDPQDPGALYRQMQSQSPPMPGTSGGPSMPTWLQQFGQPQQPPPGWGLDALGPNANPYAMPGTPQWSG